MKLVNLLKNPYYISQFYSSAVAYILVETQEGVQTIGSAFHIGDNIYVTARHVVWDMTVLQIATTLDGLVADSSGNMTIKDQVTGAISGTYSSTRPAVGKIVEPIYFHPDPDVDVAIFRVEGIVAPFLKLGTHIVDDWVSAELHQLRQVIVLGYPRIPFADDTVLVAARGEVNAVIKKYMGRHIHFIVSAMARGGFSGGPCLSDDGTVLGMIVESLHDHDKHYEPGYMAAISIEPIIDCLQHHGLQPSTQNFDPEENWD